MKRVVMGLLVVASSLPLAVLVLFLPRTALQPTMAQDGPQVYRNEWTETDAAGHQVRRVRWPIGTRDHVVELRIPREYIEFAGGCAGFSPGRPDPNCLQPFSTTAPLLQAMLPDLSPVPHRPLSPDEAARVVDIMMDSTFFGREKTVGEALAIHAHISVEDFAGQAGAFLQVRPWNQGLLAHKEPRFGLSRIGLLGTASAQFPGAFEDYLFLSSNTQNSDESTCQRFDPPAVWRSVPSEVVKCRDWVESSDFMQCMDESVPSSDVAKSEYVPYCEQWFGDEELSAVIKLRYRRQHLRDWKIIKSGVTNLLDNMMKGST